MKKVIMILSVLLVIAVKADPKIVINDINNLTEIPLDFTYGKKKITIKPHTGQMVTLALPLKTASKSGSTEASAHHDFEISYQPDISSSNKQENKITQKLSGLIKITLEHWTRHDVTVLLEPFNKKQVFQQDVNKAFDKNIVFYVTLSFNSRLTYAGKKEYYLTCTITSQDRFDKTVQDMQKLAAESTPKATPGKPWVFEFKNKSKEDLQVNIKYEAREFILNPSIAATHVNKSTGSKEENHGYVRLAGFDPKASMEIYIWSLSEKDKKDKDKVERMLKDGSTAQHEIYIKDNKDRNTVLLTFENNKVRAQKGTIGGIGSSSQSGLPTKGNVKASDIFTKK